MSLLDLSNGAHFVSGRETGDGHDAPAVETGAGLVAGTETETETGTGGGRDRGTEGLGLEIAGGVGREIGRGPEAGLEIGIETGTETETGTGTGTETEIVNVDEVTVPLLSKTKGHRRRIRKMDPSPRLQISYLILQK